VIAADARERPAAEVDAALEIAGHDDVVGRVDGDARGHVGERAAETLRPEKFPGRIVFHDEAVLVTGAHYRARSEVDRVEEKAARERVAARIDRQILDAFGLDRAEAGAPLVQVGALALAVACLGGAAGSARIV